MKPVAERERTDKYDQEGRAPFLPIEYARLLCWLLPVRAHRACMCEVMACYLSFAACVCVHCVYMRI